MPSFLPPRLRIDAGRARVRRAHRIATGKAPRWTAFQNTFFNSIEQEWSANFNLGGNAFISLPAISERAQFFRTST